MDYKIIGGIALTVVGIVGVIGTVQYLPSDIKPIGTTLVVTVGGVALTLYSIKTKKAPIIKEREKIVMDVAKKYAGVVTKSLLVYEANLSLGDAKEVLDNFVKLGEARKLEIGGIESYDIPSARSSLSKIEDDIISSLLKMKGTASKTNLLAQLDYPSTSINEAIKGLTEQKILWYNAESDTYELMGAFKMCPYCKTKITVESDKCPKCGAQV